MACQVKSTWLNKKQNQKIRYSNGTVGRVCKIMTSAGSSRQKTRGFCQEKWFPSLRAAVCTRGGEKKRLLCADKGVSFDLQRKTCRQVLGSAPQLERLKGASCIGMRCRGHVENAPSLKEGWNKKKNTRREKTHQQTHINQKSVSPQLHKLTDGCSCDRPGRKRQAE